MKYLHFLIIMLVPSPHTGVPFEKDLKHLFDFFLCCKHNFDYSWTHHQIMLY